MSRPGYPISVTMSLSLPDYGFGRFKIRALVALHADGHLELIKLLGVEVY